MLYRILVLLIIFFIICTGISFASDVQTSGSNFAEKVFEKIKSGVPSGEIGAYYELSNYKRNRLIEEDKVIKLDDGDLIVPYFQVGYHTSEYSGFSMGAGLTGYTHIGSSSESKDSPEDSDKLVVYQFYLNYDIFQTSLRIGRQELDDSVLLRDYYEAFSLTSTDIRNIFFFFAVVRKVAESDVDKFIDFQNINRGHKSINDLLYAVETTWDIIPNAITTTLYYSHQGNLYDLYGSHIEFSHETEKIAFGLRADAYATDEHDENGLKDFNDKVKNSHIYHISPFIEMSDIILAAGYIRTDHGVGAREGGLIDDYFNPLNEGGKVYMPDAQTWYGGLKHETDRVNMGLTIGSTKYHDGTRRLTEKEFDINAGLKFLDNYKLETELAIVDS
ncbi:MAG: hypothetical protein C4538_00755, partial [Nitrospiraceae bacterium]